MKKAKLTFVLEKIRINRCCPNFGACTCTPGGDGIESGYWFSEQRGCFELKKVIKLLNNMTDSEYKRILKRK